MENIERITIPASGANKCPIDAKIKWHIQYYVRPIGLLIYLHKYIINGDTANATVRFEPVFAKSETTPIIPSRTLKYPLRMGRMINVPIK